MSIGTLHAPRSPAASFGAIVIMLLVLVALAAYWVAPYDPLLQDIGARLQSPTAAHLLGTDGLGRDLLSRLIYGTRPTLILIGLVAAVMVPIGLSVGIVGGYYGGWLERLLTGVTNIVMAFPKLVQMML